MSTLRRPPDPLARPLARPPSSPRLHSAAMSHDPSGYTPQPAGYTPQYSFMPYYSAAPAELLVPAKWAGLLMIAFGVLLLLGGSCIGAAAYNVDDTVYNDVLRQMPKQDVQFQITPHLMRTAYTVMCGIAGAYGVVLAVVGLFVRGGSLVAIVFGFAAFVPPALVLLLLLVASLAQGATGILSFCMLGFVPLLFAVPTIYLLIKAAGNVSKIKLANAQLVSHQQMQQYYAYQQPPTQPS